MLKIITRKDAKKLGLKRYFTGKPCKYGHISERQIIGNCIACHNARKYDVKRHSAAVAKWRKAHPEKSKPIKARSDRRYREKYRDKMLAYARAWAKANPGKALAHCRAKQAAKARRTPAWADLRSIESVYVRAAEVSKLAGIKMHVDHVIPLNGEIVSGLHVHDNLRIIPAAQNVRKSNKFDGAYA